MLDRPRNFTDAARNVSSPEHIALADEIVVNGMVMLKNQGNFLPLKNSSQNILVVGEQSILPFTHTTWWSGNVDTNFIFSPIQAIARELGIPQH